MNIEKNQIQRIYKEIRQLLQKVLFYKIQSYEKYKRKNKVELFYFRITQENTNEEDIKYKMK